MQANYGTWASVDFGIHGGFWNQPPTDKEGWLYLNCHQGLQVLLSIVYKQQQETDESYKWYYKKKWIVFTGIINWIHDKWSVPIITRCSPPSKTYPFWIRSDIIISCFKTTTNASAVSRNNTSSKMFKWYWCSVRFTVSHLPQALCLSEPQFPHL